MNIQNKIIESAKFFFLERAGFHFLESPVSRVFYSVKLPLRGPQPRAGEEAEEVGGSPGLDAAGLFEQFPASLQGGETRGPEFGPLICLVPRPGIGVRV